MKLEGRIYCEGPDCETSAHLGCDTMEAGRLIPGFLRVVEYGSRDREMAFCCWDCLMKYAARFEPPTIIPAGDPDA